ncbi:venom plasminogen activator-like [Alosa pseudoharengus]|uniref:venom plasminogen activator-like n=1 Tax=Alosa pseudoharengus TaxID=34774 RepID=UPI003F8860B2
MRKICVVLTLLLIAGVSVGDIQKRIDGGRTCSDDEKKQFVFLTNEDYMCSGSVIGNGQWVLTAKHCDTGKLSSSYTIMNIGGQTQTSSDLKVHPKADLMLIKLTKKWTSIPLASATACATIKKTFSKTTPVNFVVVGRETRGVIGDMKEWIQQVFKGKKEQPRCGSIAIELCVQETETGAICFSGKNVGSSTIGGDSGGAYLYNSELYGVHSGRDTYGNPMGLSICEKEIRDWIDDQMNNNP